MTMVMRYGKNYLLVWPAEIASQASAPQSTVHWLGEVYVRLSCMSPLQSTVGTFTLLPTAMQRSLAPSVVDQYLAFSSIPRNCMSPWCVVLCTSL